MAFTLLNLESASPNAPAEGEIEELSELSPVLLEEVGGARNSFWAI